MQLDNCNIKLPIKKIKSKTITLEDIGEIKYGPVSEKTLFKAQSTINVHSFESQNE